MARQRGELVPIGKVIVDLPGPVQALRKTPPPARRGFTLADQVNQLVGASEADPDLGFMARMMALCSLPRTNPGNRHQYKRVNGPFRLYMQAGAETKLPFGNIPPITDGLGVYGSCADALPRARFRPVSGRVHANARHLE